MLGGNRNRARARWPSCVYGGARVIIGDGGAAAAGPCDRRPLEGGVGGGGQVAAAALGGTVRFHTRRVFVGMFLSSVGVRAYSHFNNIHPERYIVVHNNFISLFVDHNIISVLFRRRDRAYVCYNL